MPLFKINIPANAGLFFKQIMQIAAFDIIEIGEPLDKLLNLEPTEPINDNFEAVGFESIYLLNNMGTFAIAYFIWILAAIIALFLKICMKWSKKLKRAYNRLRRKLFFNSLISLFLESYSLISVCCLINLSFLSFASYGVTVQSVSCILFFIAIILMPLILFVYLLKFFTDLQDPTMTTKYGHLYDELDLRQGKTTLI